MTTPPRQRDYSVNPLPYSKNHTNHLPEGEDLAGTFQRMPVPTADRGLTILLCASVIAYSVFGLWIGDLIVPAFKPGRSDTHVDTVVARWLLAGAVCCMVALWVCVYGRRSMLVERRPMSDDIGEWHFSRFKPVYGSSEQLLRALAWLLFIGAVGAHVLGV